MVPEQVRMGGMRGDKLHLTQRTQQTVAPNDEWLRYHPCHYLLFHRTEDAEAARLLSLPRSSSSAAELEFRHDLGQHRGVIPVLFV